MVWRGDRVELAMTWAMPPVARDQWVLFESSLDEVIPDDHLVRVLDAILRSLDWGPFEAKYHGTLRPRRISLSRCTPSYE